MRLRVVETKDGRFLSEYYCEHRNLGWTGTYRNNYSITQNEFFSLDEAIAECKWFAENNSTGKVVWEEDL